MNISSLEKHFYEFLALSKLLNHSFDIMGISETRLTPSSSMNIDLPDYSFIHNLSDTCAGGTGLFISNKLSYVPRNDLSNSFSSSGLLESTFCEIKLKNKKNVLVGCIYKHPSMNIDLFNDSFLSPLLNKISSENKFLVLMGDFNINLLHCDKSLPNANFLDTFGAYHMLPQITLPTRITSQSNTLIDNIFISDTSLSTSSGNLMVGISDHLPQFLLLNQKVKTASKKVNNIMHRSWSSFNPENFQNDFNSVNWSEVLSLDKNNSEASFNCFLDQFNLLFDKHVPLKKLTRNQVKLRDKPWISNGLLTSMKVRDSILCDLNNTSDPDHKTFLHSRYKFYRNRIVSLLRLSKKIHFNSYFRENSANLRKVWQGIREIISLKTKSSPDISLQINNSISSDPHIISESFNTFFSNVASNVRSRIPPSRHHFSEWLKIPNPNSIFVHPTSPNEILKFIHLNPVKQVVLTAYLCNF